MSKESSSAVLEADYQTQETKSFIKQVRRITDAQEGKSPPQCYAWKLEELSDEYGMDKG